MRTKEIIFTDRASSISELIFEVTEYASDNGDDEESTSEAASRASGYEFRRESASRASVATTLELYHSLADILVSSPAGSCVDQPKSSSADSLAREMPTDLFNNLTSVHHNAAFDDR
jgi:hypothetical protein